MEFVDRKSADLDLLFNRLPFRPLPWNRVLKKQLLHFRCRGVAHFVRRGGSFFCHSPLVILQREAKLGLDLPDFFVAITEAKNPYVCKKAFKLPTHKICYRFCRDSPIMLSVSLGLECAPRRSPFVGKLAWRQNFFCSTSLRSPSHFSFRCHFLYTRVVLNFVAFEGVVVKAVTFSSTNLSS